jgi:DNA replication protein DnaC
LTLPDRQSSHLSFPSRLEVIGDLTNADAILDRLTHNAHRIELSGESLRRARSKEAKST